MKRESNFGEINLDVSVGREPRTNLPQDDTPFRIVLIGDFSGRSLSERRANLGALQPSQSIVTISTKCSVKFGPRSDCRAKAMLQPRPSLSPISTIFILTVFSSGRPCSKSSGA